MTTQFTPADESWMQHALALAGRGAWTTKPNPMVGCVLVADDRIVGEGWHQWAGQAHAEVLALQAAGDAARGATAYITLEPCHRHGRTPPCVEALIAAGVARVVFACADPAQCDDSTDNDDNDADTGDSEGLERLRAAGMQVEGGLLAAQARELNRGFFARIERKRPWLRVKLGMSLDGRTALADGRSQWITGEHARADVMAWRARSSALLTGSSTVRHDNPRLTVRLDGTPPTTAPDGSAATAESAFVPPLRVVLDTGLAIPTNSHLLDGSVATLVFHAGNARPAAHFAQTSTIAVPEQRGLLDLPTVLAELAQRGCNEIQVEAGATLAGAFVAAGLCDELLLYVAPRLLGDSARSLLRLPALSALSEARSWQWHDCQRLGEDLRLCLRPPAP